MAATPSSPEELQQRVTQLEAQVATLTRELQSFTYAVSHDLRAPLRSILGFSQILLDELSGSLSAEHQRHCERILESGNKLSRLIDGLLEISRAGTAELQIRDIDVTQQVLTALESLPERPATLHIEVQPDMHVRADPKAMRTILLQLLRNAVAACRSRAAGRVSVTQQSDAHTTTLCVADNGIGFDPQYNDKVFAPFQRLHADPALAGKGIGLALVQRLVARHGGRVRAEGQRDQGAKFFIELPRAAPK